MAGPYYLGGLVRLRCFFHDTSDELDDPTAVHVQVKDPNGTETSYTYGVDEAVNREEAGSYYIDVDVNVHGNWSYRWYSTGSLQSAREASFSVNKSRFE